MFSCLLMHLLNLLSTLFHARVYTACQYMHKHNFTYTLLINIVFIVRSTIVFKCLLIRNINKIIFLLTAASDHFAEAVLHYKLYCDVLVFNSINQNSLKMQLWNFPHSWFFCHNILKYQIKLCNQFLKIVLLFEQSCAKSQPLFRKWGAARFIRVT